MKKVHTVGWCYFCNQGWLILAKEIKTSNLYVCCKECETQWENPHRIGPNDCLSFEKYGVYELPTEEEIINKGWSEFLKNYYEKK